MDDLAVIVVSTNEAGWLEPCLRTVYGHAGDIVLDVVVADNQSTDGTRDLVAREFPEARVVTCDNHGFAHANNRGLMTCDARYVLFLNPDTEILDGTFAELVRALDERPGVGLVGVRQVGPDGELLPTIRRFPNALRAFAEALGSEKLPLHAGWLGERERDLSRYSRELVCDWVSGSFMLARREAVESAGYLDERFFIYSEEPDFCSRMKQAGWETRHLPLMTIAHHAGKGGIRPKMAAQDAIARSQYAQKYFSPPHRVAYVAALAAGYALRYGFGNGRREASRRALRALFGLDEPPFGAPPPQAVRSRRESGGRTP